MPRPPPAMTDMAANSGAPAITDHSCVVNRFLLVIVRDLLGLGWSCSGLVDWDAGRPRAWRRSVDAVDPRPQRGDVRAECLAASWVSEIQLVCRPRWMLLWR